MVPLSLGFSSIILAGIVCLQGSGSESEPTFLGIRAVEAKSEVPSCLETFSHSRGEVANLKDYMNAS